MSSCLINLFIYTVSYDGFSLVNLKKMVFSNNDKIVISKVFKVQQKLQGNYELFDILFPFSTDSCALPVVEILLKIDQTLFENHYCT